MKAPPFDWTEFHKALEENPDFDPFTRFSFHQISKAERGEIARRLIDARLKRAKPAQEATQ